MADVAIIGGGFTGLSAALHLAEQGVAVRVIEAGEIGSCASGRNGGLVVPNFAKADPSVVQARLGMEAGNRLLELIGGAGDAVFDLIKRLGIECDAEQTGWIQPAHRAEVLKALERRCEEWAARGRPVALLDRDELSRLTGCEKFFGGWVDRSGGQLNPLKYVRGLAKAAMDAGAHVHTGARINSMERTARRWTLKSNGGTITADQVLLCTNAEVGRLWPRLMRSFIPLTVHQLATVPISDALANRISPGRQPVSDTSTNLFSYRLDRENRLISGGMAALPWGADGRMVRYIAQRLDHMLDLGGVPRVEHIWHGTAAVTPDFLPRLHMLAPGLHAGLGCNGRGIAMTTVLGQVLAQAAQQGHARGLAVPLNELTPLRGHFLMRHAPRVAIPLARWRGTRLRGTRLRGSRQ
ncbi:MAG: NAD(P)/FAD-dependent oxidoreductase [Alphaproteobacteria bacterium]